jgi:hypothetical protein
MIDKPLDAIEAADIESLCFRRASESRTLEFKRELPGKSDEDVKEFLDDVTSMANAQGGDMIFGIAEDGGMATEVALLELVDRGEAEILRLENSLRDNVEPRVTVHPRWVAYGPDRGVLVLRIPLSLAYPHRRHYRGRSKFSSRNSAGKYEMDVYELRQAFTQSEQLPARFRELHQSALRKAKGEDEMPFALNADPTAVVTIAPQGLFRDRRDLPIKREEAVLPPKAGANDILITLEGALASTTVAEGDRLRAYVLTHRVGYVDAAWTIGGTREADDGRQLKVVWSASFEEGLAEIARATSARFLQFGIEGPWVTMVTVFGIHGFQLTLDRHFGSKPAWRSAASFEPLLTPDLTPDALEPIFKSLWRLFGEERPA